MHRKLDVVILALAAGLVGGLVQSSIAPVAARDPTLALGSRDSLPR